MFLRLYRGDLNFFAVVLLAMAVVSCIKEEQQPVLQESDKISFNVALERGLVTKSDDGTITEQSFVRDNNASTHFLCSFGEDSIYISVSEQDNYVVWAAGADTAAPVTKGAPIVDPSGSGNVLSEFWTSAKLDGGAVYFADERVGVDAGSTNRYWPPDVNLNFMAYAPVGAKIGAEKFIYEENQWTGSFNYSMPADGEDGNDAVILPDYIYALESGRNKTGGVVELVFHHAFSAICFKVGTMPKNVTVKHIALNDIWSGGNCGFKGDGGNLVFEWSNQSDKKSFKQELGVALNASDGSLVKEDDLNTAEQTFMVVPQVLPDGASFEVCFSVDGTEYTLSKSISDITAEWLADKRYVYSISIPEEVDIEITDNVVGAVKNNVQMTNKGLANSYIRSAVFGYWIVESGDDEYIVEDWKESDGKFVYGATWNEHWKLNDDGFYYYKYQLAPGELPAVPLFDSYTVTATPPVVNAKLQLNVMVQAVIASELGSANWPWNLGSGDGWFVESVKP